MGFLWHLLSSASCLVSATMEYNILSVVGVFFLVYHGVKFALQLIQGIKTFVLPSLGFRKNLRAFGSWAVVTGCTDGIGKSYAKQLAKQGINIVLMSRNLEKLQKVDKEIKSQYNVETRSIVIDFTGGQEIYQDIGDKLKDLEIGILVNNVGMAIGADCFHLISREKNAKIINVNILSYVMMTHIVLPIMVARKSGLIINVSSYGALVPNPLIANYSSTKAFVDFLSYCINREYSDKGIHVQCVMPWYVSTNMTGNMSTNLFVPSSDCYVNQAIGTVGMEQRTCGYWSHSVLAFIQMNLLPKAVLQALLWKMWSFVRQNGIGDLKKYS